MNKYSKNGHWIAGAAQVDISPAGTPYLCGYPNVHRLAEGIHDRLMASALCLSDGESCCIFVACDLLNLPCDLVARARGRISALTGVPVDHIMLTATHTHSGPLAVAMVTNEADPHVPGPDPAFLDDLENRIVEAAASACQGCRPVDLSSSTGDGTALGGNRHDPEGPSDGRLPVLVVRDVDTQQAIAVMAICSMHPTVLHEDWKKISGDFPGMARIWLQEHVIGHQCPFIYHMGASGNQSPRHVVRANTIAEATRLGEVLGRAVESAMRDAQPVGPARVRCLSRFVDLPIRAFPSVQEAERREQEAESCLRQVRSQGESRARVRTAEVDWFGSQKGLALSRAAEVGRLEEVVQSRMPAEVQVISVGGLVWIGWPGEVFVEFALEATRGRPGASIITLANGELHGYLVTQEAVDARRYEASHGIFESPASGQRLVEATRELLQELDRDELG